jgi:hypothetical protein
MALTRKTIGCRWRVPRPRKGAGGAASIQLGVDVKLRLIGNLIFDQNTFCGVLIDI